MIRPLTSLRFFFAAMVFFHHLCWLEGADSELYERIYSLVIEEGFIGVHFFFILSGFILTHVYWKKLQEKTFSTKNFYIFRIARIYPLHLVTLLLAVPLTYKTMRGDFSSWLLMFLGNLTLTQSFNPIKDYYFSLNIVSWAISDEMFFYLLFPILLPLLAKKYIRRFIGIFLFLTGITLLLMYLVISDQYRHCVFYVNPLFRVLDFILGMLLCFLKDRLEIVKLHRGTIYELGSFVVFAVFFMFHPFVPRVLRYSIYYWIPMASIILVFYYESGIVSKWLSNGLFVLLGEMSFAFYLTHYLVLKYVNAINNRYPLWEDNIVAYAIAVACCFAITIMISFFVLRLFEEPLRKYLINRYTKPAVGSLHG